MKEILGEAKTVRQLLSGAKYALDYYQRDYKWQTKQVSELVGDLTDKFLGSFDSQHDRSAVADYDHYFLGSIVMSRREGAKYVIDGQQRLTTLTLLLIYLHNLQSGRQDVVSVGDLIFSEKFGRRSFNIDVAEREPAMDALFQGQLFDSTDQPESVANIVARYQDIEPAFPAELTGNALPYFIDWLIENVHLVEISASSDEDAYTIFETMNDRGLSLSPTDMLKGYLLANIANQEDKGRANAIWKRRLGRLTDLAKDEDADFLKAWLRSQYAATIRQRTRGATPQDFDLLGTEFHRWVRDHETELELNGSQDFFDFIEGKFTFYSRQYERLRRASLELTRGLESVFYNAQLDFTLQYPVLLAPLMPSDSDDVIAEKLRVTSAYLDIVLARRLWNFRINAYSTMQYTMFVLTRDVRGREIDELGKILRARLDGQTETFFSNSGFYLHQQNRRSIHQILARMTDHLETESGRPSHFREYVGGTGNNRYEIEHIWADSPERHRDEFAHPTDFAEYRNRIGDLLLLPKSFNASYGALEYTEKLPHYYGQNLLAQSLHPNAYERDPGFRTFVQRTGLSFRPVSEFRRADLDERQRLYEQLAQRIWDPNRVYPEPISEEDLADLDLFVEEDASDAGEDEGTDRSYWISRLGGESHLGAADLLCDLLQEVVDPSVELNFRKRHIGLKRGGRVDNFVVVSPRSREPHTVLGFRILEDSGLTAEIHESGLDFMRYTRRGHRYLIRVVESDFTSRRDTLVALARAASTPGPHG